jgi:hypothetical protein
VLNNGEYVRVFDLSTGVLRWQHWTGTVPKRPTKVASAQGMTAVLSDSSVTGFNRQGKLKWTVSLAQQSVEGIVNIFAHDESFVVVGGTNGIEATAVWINAKSGTVEGQNKVALASFNDAKCLLSATVLGCYDESNVFAVDFSLSQPKLTKLAVNDVVGLQPLDLPGYFIVESVSKNVVVHFSADKLQTQLSFESTSVTASTNGVTDSSEETTALFAAYYDNQRVAMFFDLRSGDVITTIKLPSDNQAPLRQLRFISSGKVIQVFVVRRDCRVDFYETQISRTDASLEWSRFEGLASISSVEMVDMPLSESQAGIETEFSTPNDPMWRTFLLRVSSQAEQLRRFFLKIADRFAEMFELITKNKVPVIDVLRNFIGYGMRRSQRPRPASTEAIAEVSMERDFFNLRKVIVVSTLSGSVYGLHSDDGAILWSLYLGDHVEPLTNQLGHSSIPLFLQRGTAYFQYSSVTIVAFNQKNSKKTRLIAFNPVTGKVMDILETDRLSSINLLPFVDEEMLWPAVLISESNDVLFYPSLKENYKSQYPIHLLNTDIKKGKISGSLLDIPQRVVKTVWQGDLNLADGEQIVAIKGKPVHEKVHSQGKVLGDRSVLYKYANPNLLAVASVNEKETTLTINLVDGVSGNIVHTARQNKALAPVHMVHCENWLVYTYWNVKARRTELGVIELYEGSEQSNPEQFDSLVNINNDLIVSAQSYVFSQGVSAMAASDTEQGLTTRSILIAMPFGGILEVTRRFVDARRPFEMTPELREEMVVPYMPEIPIATEDLINYNQTAFAISGIKTAPSGLESTSLVLAYGLDLFFTRVTPSGTFDILKDDFDYALISLVLIVLILASFICKRLARARSVKQAWS